MGLPWQPLDLQANCPPTAQRSKQIQGAIKNMGQTERTSDQQNTLPKCTEEAAAAAAAPAAARVELQHVPPEPPPHSLGEGRASAGSSRRHHQHHPHPRAADQHIEQKMRQQKTRVVRVVRVETLCANETIQENGGGGREVEVRYATISGSGLMPCAGA